MSNNKAIIAKIDSVQEITGADSIQQAKVLGETVVVSKDWQVGMVGVFFPADTQLSEDFCRENNLHRDSSLNLDENAKGFFDKNRKVRAQPFMKVRSEGFFAQLDSLSFTGYDLSKLELGMSFEDLNDVHIAKKFISEKTRQAMNNVQKTKTKTVETPMFHQHVDTANIKYALNSITKGDLISIHAKVHGTSARYSHSKVKRIKTGFIAGLKRFFTGEEQYEEGYEYLVGTRRVVLYEDQYNKEGFHGSEQYRFDVLEMLKPHLDKGITVYGEIAGYANGKPIMGTHSTKVLKDKAFNKKYGEAMTYKYGCTEESFRFHVYRVTMTNEDGVTVDFSDAQVKEWAESRGFLAPLAVTEPFIYDGDEKALTELVERLTERPECLTEDYIDPTHVSEGVIVRVDNGLTTPKFFKSKSYAFKVMEGIFKEDNVDVEDAA